MPDLTPDDNVVTMEIPNPTPIGTAQAEGEATPVIPIDTIQSQSIPPDTIPVEAPQKTADILGGNPSVEASPVGPTKNLGGRPCTICQNMDEYLRITQQYLDRTLGRNGAKPGIPYIEELAIELSAHRETVMEWAKNEADHPLFSDTIKRLQDVQRLRLQQRVMGRYNPTGAIFLLKANHGLMESEKKILAGDKNEPIQVEIIEEAKAILKDES